MTHKIIVSTRKILKTGSAMLATQTFRSSTLFLITTKAKWTRFYKLYMKIASLPISKTSFDNKLNWVTWKRKRLRQFLFIKLINQIPFWSSKNICSCLFQKRPRKSTKKPKQRKRNLHLERAFIRIYLGNFWNT